MTTKPTEAESLPEVCPDCGNASLGWDLQDFVLVDGVRYAERMHVCPNCGWFGEVRLFRGRGPSVMDKVEAWAATRPDVWLVVKE